MKASVPDPVPSPQIEFFDERHIGVKWNRPPCRGDPVTMYDLSHLVSGNNWESMGNWKTELRTSSMFYVVPNLLPGSSHCFRLRAFNSLGWGEFGLPCIAIKTKADVPATPDTPKMIKWDGTMITIAWNHNPRKVRKLCFLLSSIFFFPNVYFYLFCETFLEKPRPLTTYIIIQLIVLVI